MDTGQKEVLPLTFKVFGDSIDIFICFSDSNYYGRITP